MDQVTFNDVFKKSFLAMSGNASSVSPMDIIVNILMSFIVGMFIYYIYKKTFQGVLYQKTFNVSLVLVATVTSLIIMTISGNIVLSLGMVGALSIVRFRTPLKDSIDLVFVFWAICVGIANGVGYFTISIIGSIFIGILLLILSRKGTTENPYLLIIQTPPHVREAEILEFLKTKVKVYRVKTRTINQTQSELTIETKLKNNDTSFVENFSQINENIRATLISYQNDLGNI